MAPLYLPGLVLQRFEHVLRPEVATRSPVTFGIRACVREVGHAVATGRIDVKQASLWAVAGGHPVGSTTSVDSQQISIHSRLSLWVRDGLPFGINPLGPVQPNEWLGHNVSSVGPVEDEKITVACRLGQQLSRLAIDLGIKKNRRFGIVPVVGIVGRSLKIPNQFAGVRIERDDRTRPKISPRSALPRHHRICVAGSPINEVKLRIVRPRQPSHTAAMAHRAFVRPGL